MNEQKEIWFRLPNGSEIEREYLTRNIQEAKRESKFEWKRYKDVYPSADSHVHCEVCWQAIASFQDDYTKDSAYYSNETWVCDQCYNLFIANDLEKGIETLDKIEK